MKWRCYYSVSGSRSPLEKEGRNDKILSVEDDKLIRDELETLLVNAGFSVRSGQAQVFKIQPAV